MFNIPFFRRASETFGLDIGSSAVKVVQLQGTSLVALGIAPLPADVIADGTIKAIYAKYGVEYRTPMD